MPAAPPQPACESRGERAVTSGIVGAALLTAAAWWTWRISVSLDGAFLPLALPLLLVDVIVVARFAAQAIPGLRLAMAGRVDDPDDEATARVVVVVGDEPIPTVRLALASCLRIRGAADIVVVCARPRPDVEAVAWIHGLRVARTDHAAHQRCDLSLLVPADLLVAPDVVRLLAPALDEPGTAAVTGATTVHATVSLVGSAGYPFAVDEDERLAARLDGAGCAPPLTGPVLFRTAALDDAGGPDWTAPAPILDAHRRVRDAGGRTRFVHPPVAYRMAPTSEAHAQHARWARAAGWRAGSWPADGSRRNLPALSARLDRLGAVGRVALLTCLVVAALTGRLALTIGEPALAGAVALAWFGTAHVARGRLLGRRPALFEQLRTGVRTLGVDLAATFGSSTPTVRGAERRHSFALAGVLVAVALTLWGAIGLDTGRSSSARLGLAIAGLGAAALVRDAATGFRQQRQLPRVALANEGPGALVDISPLGYRLRARYRPGTEHRITVAVPLPDGQRRQLHLAGRVVKSRSGPEGRTAQVRIEPDSDDFDALYYFCAVTAPTMRWHGEAPTVEVLDSAAVVS